MTSISVIIPAYRAEKFIAAAVSSVLVQTMDFLEVVIASDDGRDYLKILKDQGIGDARLRCVSTGGVRTGLSHARNTAVKGAKGSIIVSLDADDALMPDYLKYVAQGALKHGVAISQVDFIDHETHERLPNHGKVFKSGLLPLQDALLACLHSYAPIAFDRTKITRLWNEELPLLEDSVFLAECCDVTGQCWYSSEPLYRYSHRKDSLCNADDAAARFIEAGNRALALLKENKIAITHPHIKSVLKAYLEKGNRIEEAFEQALRGGAAKDYQDFIGKNLTMLHAPLI